MDYFTFSDWDHVLRELKQKIINTRSEQIQTLKHCPLVIMLQRGSQIASSKAEILSKNQEETPSEHRLSLAELKPLFVDKLRKMPTEESQLATKIHSTELVPAFRKAFRRLDSEKPNGILQLQTLKGKLPRTSTLSCELTKTFFDGLVLISNQEYLDSLGFNFSLIDCPEKLFDLLVCDCDCDDGQMQLTFKDLEACKQSGQELVLLMERSASKEDLAAIMVKVLRQGIIPDIILPKNIPPLESERTRRKEFTSAWKGCSEQARIRMLYLGKGDSKQLIHYLLDRKLLLPPPEQIEKEIIELLKSDQNEFRNKVFKSRLRKSHILLEDYYELVYDMWRAVVESKKKKRANCRPRRSRTEGGHQNKGLSDESNETNETENQQEMSLDIEQLIKGKISRDILDYSDKISGEANQFYDRKVEAFKRLEYLVQTYFQSQLHLFGSCACGLAVKKSDIDVAIDESFLQHFEYVPQSKRVGAALQYFASNLELRPWVKSLKVINTASIPIIKLTIDTSIPMYELYMNQSDFTALNTDHNHGEIDVDLTIQTKNQSFGPTHLGIVSTHKMQEWLGEIEKLHEITIILKYYLTAKSLNNTYSGGLKTYSLVVMIIAYIRDRNLSSCCSIQTIMKGLTHFYGYQFDQNKLGINLVSETGIFYEKTPTIGNLSAALEVKDPINGKIMTKSCYSFERIKKLMREIYEKCFEKSQFQIEGFCSGLNPKTRRIATFEILQEFNEAFPENYFMKVLGEGAI